MVLKKLIIPFFVLIAAFFVTGCSMAPAESDDATKQQTQEETAPEQEVNQADAISVTVYEPETASSSIELLGQVSNNADVTVAPATSGQVTAVNVKDGDTVKAGEVLFVLGGANGSKHPYVTQYETAQANYNAAVSGYNNAVKSSQIAVSTAELQLQSAKHQAEASIIDYNAFGENIETSKDGIALIRTNLSETQIKNQRDLDNLLESVNDLEDDRKELVLDFEELIDNAMDEATEAALEDEFEAAKDALDAQIEQLEDQYDNLQSASILSENQLKAQLQQAESQHHSLYTTVDSTAARLGLNDGVTDQVLLAEQGLNSAKTQSQVAMNQATTQLDLAELNLQTAADQQQLLLVKAPVAGLIDNVTAAVGQTVAPQNVLASLVNSEGFVLEVGVDTENADNLVAGDMAEVQIGDKFMKSPILSISPSAGAQSRLVTVRVQLPKIGFRENQSVRVRLPIHTQATTEDSFFVPLDAVIIGSSEQFAYIVKDGKAEQVSVELGDINGSLVEIIGGELKKTDQLIVDGAKEVNQGQPVNIV